MENEAAQQPQSPAASPVMSRRAREANPFRAMVFGEQADKMIAQGISVIKLSLGEPDFGAPPAVRDAMREQYDGRALPYTAAMGLPELRQAIADFYRERHDLDIDPKRICVTAGGSAALLLATALTVDPGDDVIVADPSYPCNRELVRSFEGRVIDVPTSAATRFHLTADLCSQYWTSKTKAVMITSPSNPTGSIYSRAELEALAEVLKKHERIIVLSDEIYEHINYVGEHASMAQVDGMKERTVIINGVSKAYAMTGWRIGFIAGPEWIVKACNKLQGQYTSGPCSVSQIAAAEAFAGDQTCVEQMRQAFEKRKDLIVGLMKDIPGIEVNDPHGAFYVFPKCDSYFGKRDGDKVINDDNDLALYLLETGHVATVCGTAFGAPGYLRMSYATSDDNIREAMKRIKETLARLK